MISHANNDDSLLHAMVSCHSLALVDDELSGDPLDVKMFEATSWMFENAPDSGFATTVVRPKIIPFLADTEPVGFLS